MARAKQINNNKSKNKKQIENFVNRAWSVVGACLDVLESRLTMMKEDVGSVEVSKVAQMFGSIFDRLMEVIGDEDNEQIVKKLEDFE